MNAPLPKPIQQSIEAAHAAQAQLAQVTPVAQDGVLNDPAQLISAAAPAAPVVSAPPVASTPAPATPPSELSNTDKDLEHKFRSMQGRLSAALGEAQAQNKTLMSQVSQLTQQVEALLTAAKAAEKKQSVAADPKDVEAFGADMVEMVKRYAELTFQNLSDQFGQSMQAVTARLNKLEEAVTGVSSRAEETLEQQFYAALAAAVPDWEQINADSRWLEWLGGVDPVYGLQRQAALDNARAKLDVKRTVNIFRAFKAQFPARTPESLSSQVAPSGAAAPAPASDAPAKPILSQKFVEKFYNDKAKGRLSEDDAARIEAEINLAAAEGRIR